MAYIADDAKLTPLDKLPVISLKQDLAAANIDFDHRALKAELQALWALHALGHLDPTKDVVPEELHNIIVWCNMTATTLAKELEKTGLVPQKNRWMRLQVLIEDAFGQVNSNGEVVDVESALENLGLDGNNEVSKELNHRVVNLLTTMVFAGQEIAATTNLLDGHPASAQTLHARLSAIPRLYNAEQLKNSLEAPFTPVGEMLTWICSKFGESIIPAAGDLKIHRMSTAHQFVVAKHVPRLQKTFDKHFKAQQSKSIVLFHGTSIQALLSILRNGFYAASDKRFGDGIFMSEDPSVCMEYATGHGGSGWQNSPYNNRYVLLGCEVAGKGRPIQDDEHIGTHVITQMNSAILRYIFLVSDDHDLPDIHRADTQFHEAFRNIREGKF